MSQVKSLRATIKFKDTPIGKIPVDWELLPLAKVAEIIMGQSPPSSDYNDYGEGLPFYQGNANFGTKYPAPNKWCNQPLKIAEKGDILISVRAPVGEINVAPHECCIGRGLGAIRATEVDADYLYQMLLFYRKLLEMTSQGSTFGAVNRKNIAHFAISYPPLPEQRKIAEILTEVDETIEITDRVIEKAKELKKGLMQQLLTRGIGHKKFKKTGAGEIPEEWDVVGMKELYKSPIRDFGSFSTTKLVKYVERGIPFLRSDNFKDGKLVHENVLYIKDEVHKILSKSVISKGIIMFTKIGNIGHADIYDGRYGNCNSNATIAKIDIDEEKALPCYIRWFLNSEVASRQYKVKVISTPPRINLGEISKLKIPIPPPPEQRKIAEILTAVDLKIESEGKKKQELVTLKKGLMQVLLTGKIRVKVA